MKKGKAGIENREVRELATLCLDYGRILDGAYSAEKAAREAADYACGIKRELAYKIDCLPGGNSLHMYAAKNYFEKKLVSLNNKEAKFLGAAKNLRSFADMAKEADKRVALKFRGQFQVFKKKENIKINPIVAAVSWIANQRADISLFFRKTDELGQKIFAVAEDAKDAIKHWYVMEGGKYAVEAGVSVAEVVIAAVSVIALSASGIPALIAAVFAAVNGITKFAANITALSQNGNPAWAVRIGRIDRLGTLLIKTDFGHSLLNRLSVGGGRLLHLTEGIVDALTFGQDLKDLSKKLPGIRSALFGGKTGLTKQFLDQTRGADGAKLTLESFLNGCRTIWTDKDYRQKIKAVFKQDLSRNKNATKDAISRAINGHLKEVAKEYCQKYRKLHENDSMFRFSNKQESYSSIKNISENVKNTVDMIRGKYTVKDLFLDRTEYFNTFKKDSIKLSEFAKPWKGIKDMRDRIRSFYQWRQYESQTN